MTLSRILATAAVTAPLTLAPLVSAGPASAMTPTPNRPTSGATPTPNRPTSGATPTRAHPASAATTTHAIRQRDAALRRAVTRAVRTSPLTAAVPPKDYRVTDIRVSHRSPAWAFARVQPTVPDLDPATVILQHTHGWTLREIGTDQVGCDVAPPSVLREFHVACH